MKFLNPWGLWLLLLIPVLILIYILRARHEERSVSSTFIWKLSSKFMKQRLPFRKMRKIILFVCQLLMIAAVALLAAKPAIVSEDGGEEYVLILDGSASMNIANSKGETRFQRAADQINDLAANTMYGTKISVILASEEATYLVKRTDSVSEIRVALNSAVCGKSKANMTEALSLAQLLCDENPVTDVILYSDADCEETENVTVVNVAEEEWNVSFTSLTYEKEEETYVFTAEVYSSKDARINIALSADGMIFDATQLNCKANTPLPVTFKADDLENFNVVTVYTDAKDGMEEDNSYSVCKKREDIIDVLLISENPFYLKSVFSAMENCQVTVAEPGNNFLLAYGGFGLYVFDGSVPGVLPPDGSIWMFSPDSVPSDMALTDKTGSDSRLTLSRGNTGALYTSLANTLTLDKAAVNNYKRIVAGKSWESLLSCGDDPVLLARKEKNGTKTVVFAFDLHDSNLPLLSDYVLLMNELLAYSFPDMLTDMDYSVAESVPISVLPMSEYLFVKTADEKIVSLSTKTQTASIIPDAVGVYSAAQTLSTGMAHYMDFFVHLPISEMMGQGTPESLSVELPELGGENEMQAEDGIREIRFYVLLALLLLILTEWGVYYYEQF